MDLKRLEDIYDLLTSNKDYNLKLFVPPDHNSSKYVYIDTKEKVIYINYLLPRESPESVLPAIVFALSHLNIGSYLIDVPEFEAMDFYVYERFLKKLGFDIIFDSIDCSRYSYEMCFEEYLNFHYQTISGVTKESIKSLSESFGNPYHLKSDEENGSGEGEGEGKGNGDGEGDGEEGSGSSDFESQEFKIQEAGNLKWEDVIQQLVDTVKDDGDESGESDSNDSISEDSRQSDDSQKNYIGSNFGTGVETTLTDSDEFLCARLREFFSLIMDRGKRFKPDSFKHFNRKSRGNTNLIYTSISKKILKSRDKWGILVDVSGSMPNEALCSILRVFSDSIGNLIDPQSVVVSWDTDFCQEFLVSEVPSRIPSGGGTNLSDGIKYLEKLNCKRIIVYSDFEDSSCYKFNETMMKAKDKGISVNCFSTQFNGNESTLLRSYSPELSLVWRQVAKR